MNQPREKNWGGPLSDSMSVYVNNGYLQTSLGFVEGDDESNWARTRLLWRAAEFFRDRVSRARKQIQRRLQTSIPSLCSYGGFGYGAANIVLAPETGIESIGLVEYDSKEGGAHGGVFGLELGPIVVGVESLRTWNDWKSYTGPILIGGDEFAAASKMFGKNVKTGTLDAGGFASWMNGEFSVGGYLGTGIFGGGGYLSASWSGCKQ